MTCHRLGLPGKAHLSGNEAFARRCAKRLKTACLGAIRLTAAADKMASDRFSSDSNQANAFRHFIWNYALMSYAGKTAYTLVRAHEKGAQILWTLSGTSTTTS